MSFGFFICRRAILKSVCVYGCELHDSDFIFANLAFFPCLRLDSFTWELSARPWVLPDLISFVNVCSRMASEGLCLEAYDFDTLPFVTAFVRHVTARWPRSLPVENCFREFRFGLRVDASVSVSEWRSFANNFAVPNHEPY